MSTDDSPVKLHEDEDIPEENLRRTLIGVLEDLSYAQVEGDEGRIFATLRITDDEDARAIARRILSSITGSTASYASANPPTPGTQQCLPTPRLEGS
jgi:hypothetical protein